MINKLPGWVEIGGFFLAALAGFVNAIGLLGFRHQSVSHLTGTSTFLSLEIAKLDTTEALHLFVVMLSFVLGAAFSGVLIGNTALKLGRRYSVALLVESALLFLSMLLLARDMHAGQYLASAACGLQNAMTSTYSGAVIRTTHVSGLFTDLGIALGLRLRGQPADRRKIILYATLIAGFVVGGIVGALGFERFAFAAMLFPSALAALLAISYGLYWYRQSRR